MDDSGIDSDQKPPINAQNIDEVQFRDGRPTLQQKLATNSSSSDLQKKLEKQMNNVRKTNISIENQPMKSSLLSRSRLVIPNSKNYSNGEIRSTTEEDTTHLLVAIPRDESEDELELPLPKSTQREIKAQLIKDGYNLDLESDDEDLDLIPPRPLQERCVCCDTTMNGCTIV